MRKSFIAFAAAVLFACASLPVCAAEKEDDYVVRIPISASLCSAPMQLAVINGYFDAVGLKWEPVALGDRSSLDIVASGKADISYDLLQTLVQRIANGLDYAVISGVHYGCINIVASDKSGIKTVADLKGRKIGCPTSLGSDPSVLLQRVLTHSGIGCTMDNMEVSLMVFDNAVLETALTKGQIDAFVSWDPYASLVAKKHHYPIIWSQADSEMTSDEYCCFIGCTRKFAREHPGEMAKICEALQKSCDFINAHPDEAVKLTTENHYVALKDLELGAELLKKYRYNLNVKGGHESFRNCAESLLSLGIIKLNQSLDDFTEQHYVAVEGVNY
ncbi:MAG: ABC transporter substrate-binding protein [Pyramidobacter sp.]